MTMTQAIHVLGINARRHDTRQTVAALTLHSWNNTDADCERLAAAKYVLAHWRAYQKSCNARRDRLQPRDPPWCDD